MIDFTEREVLTRILNEYGLRLEKSLGQHFLVDKEDLVAMVEAADINSEDTVVEIGTGIGTLTQELCQQAGKVIAYEMDARVAKVVREKILPQYNNLELIVGDFLKEELPLGGLFKVVSNLPYQITTPAIRRFLESGLLPSKMVVMVQKEVAERLSAKPGSAKRGWVTILVELFGRAQISRFIPAEHFFPRPKVASAILIIDDIRQPTDIDVSACLKVVKAGFSQKRRQLINSLAGGLHLEPAKIREILFKAQIDPKLRAEDLDTIQWKSLTNTMKDLS
ncbi:MAG: 16S rRNA (adenine(1518)-N(6)/adenine(1519)-N(6))-dimethyltransferase RsmA [bacterium]|nr:16S rRNA (adenine(1518)-N(6)/adenine(1519)-N(6))-dimethyltransferase RsmA [bacterium]